jgi:hypothetical protein
VILGSSRIAWPFVLITMMGRLDEVKTCALEITDIHHKGNRTNILFINGST